MNIGSIISSGLNMALGGGWGSAVAVLALLIGAWVAVRAYNAYVAKKLNEQNQNQSATDQHNMVTGNQTQAGQMTNDEQAAQDAKPKPPKLLGLFIFLSVLVGCGKQVVRIELTQRLSVGTLEEIRCPEGELVVSAVPKYIAGGIVTHIEVQCGRPKVE